MSVNAMWRFVEKQVPLKSKERLQEWWKGEVQRNAPRFLFREDMFFSDGDLKWPYSSMIYSKPEEWDISVCQTAICECEMMGIKHQPKLETWTTVVSGYCGMVDAVKYQSAVFLFRI